MNLSQPFIDRPVATTLLTAGVALAGAIAFRLLPVSPLPQVDYPTISVQASLPGASPETMAATVATPLERSLGRIAGVTEMTSSSSLGSTRVVLQFDLSRSIDGAARDVQAAINAARALLPSGLPSNPTYRKVNPADAPIMILTLTSDTLTQGQMYDAASTIIAQKLSQIEGVGQVSVGGSSLPAVRVELNPDALFKYGVGLEDVRTALAAANANRPKGALEDGDRHWQVLANDQAKTAAEYLPLIVAWRNGAPVALSAVAEVVDSVQDLRNAGMANGRPSVAVIINRQPNANIIDTVDRVQELLPVLRASIPSAIDLDVAMERTVTIRASLRDTGRALAIAVVLVILVVFVFLRSGRATLIPMVAVPVSLVGTFGVMYLAGFSVNNFTLMALTIATGFVVDDAVVVLENTTRHIEEGMAPFAAAAPRRARGRLHGPVDEPLADRRLHPHPAHGRHRRPPVSRVRGDALGRDPDLARDLAHDDADDVRVPSPREGRARLRSPRRRERASVVTRSPWATGRASRSRSRTASPSCSSSPRPSRSTSTCT